MSENNIGEELGKLPPDLTLGATSEQIIRRGRRIRTIRQTSIVGAAAVAVLGITSIAALASGGHHGAQTVQSGSGNGLGIALVPPASQTSAPPASTSSAPIVKWSAPVSSAPASPTLYYAASTPPAASSARANSSSSISCAASPAPQSTEGAPAASPDGNAPPWGSLVQAGTDVGTTNSLVLYGIHIDDAAIPCTHFGLMVGTVDASGNATGVYEANEFDGSDLTPGFHAVSMVGKVFAGTYYVGYYVGPAATISVVVNGLPTAAHVAAWSVNSDVKFWWLGGSADGNPTYGALTAKDAKGNVLPVGTHAQPGVG
ncbi:MAG TPA: hypothetical protein VN683_05345 [Acidothermaceae bacterium]|nr:hypothetical protein [Acidothermaceae bacterium]